MFHHHPQIWFVQEVYDYSIIYFNDDEKIVLVILYLSKADVLFSSLFMNVWKTITTNVIYD